MNSLCLLEHLSPGNIIQKKSGDIIPLVQRFRSLAPDLSTTVEEFRSLPILYKVPNEEIEKIDPVEFWLDVYHNKDAGGNGRFENIANFALGLFCMPFSNVVIERAFSAMKLVKNLLRNRLAAESVDSVLSTRYGLKFIGIQAQNFESTTDMLRAFTSGIYINIEYHENSGNPDDASGDI